MAVGSPAQQLQSELSCFLCHQYFTEPVNIPCGHSFCQVCILHSWEGQQETDVSCPRCGAKSATRELRPIKELGGVVAIAKQMNFEAAERVAAGEEKMCELHQESLKLFCKDEGKLLCPTCARSEECATHILASVEDAVEGYKRKLKVYLELLVEEREKALDFQTKEKNKNQEFLRKVDGEKQKIVFKYEELQRFLEEQKKVMLDQLDELVKRQEKNATRLSREICVFDILIHDLVEKYKQPAGLFLQDIGETLSRLKIWEFQQPLDISPELEDKLCAISKNYLIMQATMEEFKETFPQNSTVKWVHITFDPDTAHTNLKVSANQKNLRWEPGDLTNYDSQRFVHVSCTLGCEQFTSGRHYWEVKVPAPKEAYWSVGVAKELVNRMGKNELNTREGVWAIKMDYRGLSADNHVLRSGIPKTVGVFLDYELNRVLFFDADKGKALYTFHSASFKLQKIRPFFCLQHPRHCEAECYLQLCA